MLHSNWPWRRAAWNQAVYDRSSRGSHTSAGYRMSVQPQDLLVFITTFYCCLRLFKSPSFFIDSHAKNWQKGAKDCLACASHQRLKPQTTCQSILRNDVCFSYFLSFIMWLELFSFPTFIHHLSLQKPLPSFNRQAVGCHNKSDQFSSSALQNQRKSSPDTNTQNESRFSKVKPYVLLFLFYHNCNFLYHNSSAPCHLSLEHFAVRFHLPADLSHLLGLFLLFPLFSSDPGLSFRALLAELQLYPLLVHVSRNHRRDKSENIVDLLLVWLF